VCYPTTLSCSPTCASCDGTGQYCVWVGDGGACETLLTLASGQDEPGGIAVDSHNVYWATFDSNTAIESLLSIPVTGSGSPTYVADGGYDVDHDQIASSGSRLYWATGYVVWSMNIDGGDATVLVSGPPASNGAKGLSLDSTASNLFWVNVGVGTAWDFSLDAGSATEVSSQPMACCLTSSCCDGVSDACCAKSEAICCDSITAPCSIQWDNASALVVDSESMYWIGSLGCASSEGTIFKAPLAGGQPVQLATGQADPLGLATYGSNIYWTNYGGGTVMSVSIDGGKPVVLASDRISPWGLAADGIAIYWVDEDPDSSQGTVMKLILDGGILVRLAANQAYPIKIAVDSTSVYWVNGGSTTNNGSVMKITPK
jgi:hypothetical protein